MPSSLEIVTNLTYHMRIFVVKEMIKEVDKIPNIYVHRCDNLKEILQNDQALFLLRELD